MLKRRVILLSASLLFSVFAAEFILGKFYPQKTYSALYKNSISCFAKSAVTVFTLKPNCTIPFTDFDTNETIKTQTNNLGYRGSDFPIVKPPGEKRILLEGDSFILGFGVKDQDVISSQLENQLEKINKTYSLAGAKVINAGYAGGFGPDGYFLHLKTAGVILKPDLVAFSVFVYNDLSDIGNDEWIGLGRWGEPEKVVSKTTTVDDGGRLIPLSIPLVYRIPLLRDSQVAVFTANTVGKIVPFIRHVYDKIRFAVRKPVTPTGEARDSNFLGAYDSFCIFGDSCHRQTMHLFSDLLTTIKASDSLINNLYKDTRPHFLVMLIPADFQLYPESLKKYNDSGIPYTAASQADPNPQRRIKEMLTKEKIPYLDLLPEFRKSTERLYFKNDGHWNRNGHQLAADLLAKWIEENYR